MNKIKKLIEKKSTMDYVFYVCMAFLPLLQFSIFYIGVNARSLMFVFQKYDGVNYVSNGLQNFVSVWNNLTSIPAWKDGFINSLIIKVMKKVLLVVLIIQF